MTFEQFDEYQKKLIDECIGMRDTKGKEYAHSKDRFANFNRLSEELGLKNYQIGWVYAKKHLDSIASYMKEGKTFSSEEIRGRFVDAIVYLTLIAGMVEEKDCSYPKFEVGRFARYENVVATVLAYKRHPEKQEWYYEIMYDGEKHWQLESNLSKV